jgi:hypothetical protein
LHCYLPPNEIMPAAVWGRISRLTLEVCDPWARLLLGVLPPRLGQSGAAVCDPYPKLPKFVRHRAAVALVSTEV